MKKKTIDWSQYDLDPEYLRESRYRDEKEQKKLVGQLVVLCVVSLLVLVF